MDVECVLTIPRQPKGNVLFEQIINAKKNNLIILCSTDCSDYFPIYCDKYGDGCNDNAWCNFNYTYLGCGYCMEYDDDDNVGNVSSMTTTKR